MFVNLRLDVFVLSGEQERERERARDDGDDYGDGGAEFEWTEAAEAGQNKDNGQINVKLWQMRCCLDRGHLPSRSRHHACLAQALNCVAMAAEIAGTS